MCSWTRSSPRKRSIRGKGGKRIVGTSTRAEVEDTYAEAFRSIYAEFLITARDRTWLDHAVAAATGNASSTIMCDCEAGVDRYVGPGGDESFHDARRTSRRDRPVSRAAVSQGPPRGAGAITAGADQPERADLPHGVGFNLLDTEDYFKLGRKLAFFGDGHQFRDHAARPAGVGRADPGRRIRDRSSLWLSRRIDGRQSVVHGR